jgi:cyclophilin family peptidyl-prolyl cis-trans isomerase
VLTQLEERHPNDLRVIYRHFPLIPIHNKASLAGQAAEAAGAQAHFWEMHDLLFDRFNDWVGLTPEAFQDWLLSAAGDLELDVSQFQDDLSSETYASDMQTAFENTAAAGIPGTPFVFLNEEWFRLPLTLNNLEAVLRLILLAERQYDSYPPMSLDPDAQYLAYLHLEEGDVVIQLYPEYAPLGVNSFIFLARNGWYDGTFFHNVQPDVVVEGGDPTGTGFGSPGYNFEIETDASLNFEQPGMVGLQNFGPGTNAGLFFITLAPLSEISQDLTILGRVIEGLELLQDLSAREPIEDLLSPPEEVIQSITIEEK